MVSDSTPHLDERLRADQLRLRQLELEAKAARLEAEAEQLRAQLARRQAALAQAPASSERSPERATTATPPPLKKRRAKETEPSKIPDSTKAPGPANKVEPREMAVSPKAAAPSEISKPVPPPPAVPVEPSAAEDAERELPQRSGFSRLLATTPSYLVSAVFHLVVILILAMIMLPAPEQLYKQLVVNASTLEPEEELIEELIIESPDQQLEMVEFEEPVESRAIDVADPGAADLGAIAQDIQSEVSTFGVAMNDVDMDNIGQLFGSEGEGMTDTLAGSGGAEFFGVKATGRKFVFVVDSSKSMNGGKFEAACEELMYSVMRLSKDQYFYVLFFDHDAAKMTFPGNDKPEPRAVPATRDNINALGQWIRTVELELQTNPYDCIEFALSLNPDAIYILTDGKFTDRGRTVRYLEKENLYDDPFEGTKPKRVIHTVGFYQRDGEETLIPLAKTHGGTYRFVPPPPKNQRNRR